MTAGDAEMEWVGERLTDVWRIAWLGKESGRALHDAHISKSRYGAPGRSSCKSQGKYGGLSTAAAKYAAFGRDDEFCYVEQKAHSEGKAGVNQ
jgi:hypothetical protein